MSANVTPQAYTYPSVTIQSCVKFTAKRWGQFPTISFQNGGTAGSEVVTMDSSFNITVKIQNGTSTATQIAAAVNAATNLNSLGAGDVVTALAVVGHTTDTPTTFVGVALAGGAAAAKASLVIGPLKFTAHTAGTAGNSLQVIFTSGATAGSEVVTDPNANGAPLTIQIADGISTYQQVKAAIETWQGGHTTYFDLSSTGRTLGLVAHVSDTASALSLSGGVAAAAATTGAVNGLTVAANATGVTANGVVVNLVDGGTAGSETVDDNADGSFTVHIQSGTSTVTQVRTALNADTGFAALYTATGTSSTAMKTVYQVALTGAAGPDFLGWYMDNSTTALTSSFVYFPFGSMAEDFHVKNDEASGSNTVIGSWDGVNNHFIVKATESWDAQKANRPGIYLKYGTAAPAYRAWTVNR